MIECLKLTGNKRLGLALIETITLSLTQPTQIILGRNGSGKSTLMGELTPLPGDHNDYHPGGSKFIRLHYKGVTYELTSTFNRGTGNHSFLVVETGEELNKGGTLAIQKELVFHYFNVNRDRMNILLGKTRFTSMTPMQRQDWLTMMSPVSLDYAFEIYNKLRGLKRDQDGVVKYQQQRLGKESKDIPTDAEKKQLEKRLKHLSERTETLLLAKYSVKMDNDDRVNFNILQERIRKVMSETKRVLKMYPTHPPGMDILDGPEKYTNHLKTVEDNIVRSTAIIETLSQEHGELQRQQPSKDQTLTDEMIQSIRREITTLSEKADKYSQRLSVIEPELKLPLDEVGGRQGMTDILTTLENELFTLFSEFPDNSDRRLSSSRGEKANEVYQKDSRRLTGMEQRRDALLSRLQQLKTCEKVACPKCEHEFQPGIDPNEPDTINKELDELGTMIVAVQERLKRANEYCEEINNYRDLLNRYQRIVNQYPYFPSLWKYITDQQVVVTNPSAFVTVLSEWFLAMSLTVEHNQVRDRIDVIKNKLRYIDEIDQGTIDRVNDRLKQIEKSIEVETANIRIYRQQQTQLTNYGKTITAIQQRSKELTEEYETVFRKFDQLKNQYYLEAVNEESQQAQLSLAQLKAELSDIDLRVGIIDDLNIQLNQCLTTQEDYKILVKAMNPKDGLIGRYLKGFMENVVSFINAIIARIWTYDLEVLPSKVNKDKFDYRFPLLVEKGRTEAPDISEGSGSQVDIVDFSFRLLVMKFLKLEDFPLYFDEFGITFDEEHRTNLNLLITNMVEVGQTPQVFYISHYLQEHSSLSNAEVCVIDPNNITVPKAYNQHVVIT